MCFMVMLNVNIDVINHLLHSGIIILHPILDFSACSPMLHFPFIFLLTKIVLSASVRRHMLLRVGL